MTFRSARIFFFFYLSLARKLSRPLEQSPRDPRSFDLVSGFFLGTRNKRKNRETKLGLQNDSRAHPCYNRDSITPECTRNRNPPFSPTRYYYRFHCKYASRKFTLLRLFFSFALVRYRFLFLSLALAQSLQKNMPLRISGVCPPDRARPFFFHAPFGREQIGLALNFRAPPE